MNIPKLPFYWRLSPDQGAVANLPKNLDFTFAYDSKISLLQQARSPLLLNSLETVYLQDYNIGYTQEVNSLATPYVRELRDAVASATKGVKSSGRVLEIGCGEALLLKELSEKFLCWGCDPSPMTARQISTDRLKIIHGFFSEEAFERDFFDFVFHCDVLEHVRDPVQFMKQQYNVMTEGAVVLVAVPDNSLNIRMGDISMAMHEHLNYFSATSLANCLEEAGFSVTSVYPGTYGGRLFAVAAKQHQVKTFSKTTDPTFEQFQNKAQKVLKIVHNKVNSLKGTLGWYVPLRSFPYICSLESHRDFRIFDDTPHWHACYFDGYNHPVENRTDLIKNPPQHIFICSLSFGDVIKRKLAEAAPPLVDRTFTLGELIDV